MLEPLENGDALTLDGEVQSFVMLSRPGPAQSRILTSLGFATFRIGDRHGAGMFECSHKSTQATRAPAETNETDNGES
jgi:hypothetical protein